MTSFDRDQDKRRVLEASDIVGVVGEHLTLRPKGREFAGLCPFHDDRNPSMAVVPDKQIFHCFSCGAGGDVFTFVQRYHGMSFPEALQWLADRAGIELTPFKPGPRAPGRAGGEADAGLTRAELVRTNAAAAAFFRAILAHESHGAAARAVVERRGIAPAMVEAFGVGAAPDRWDGLKLFAEKNGLAEPALLSLGLVKARESGGTYDGLRNRLVFPIRAESGDVVAFGGRKIAEEDEPKYLNSPESSLFEKRKTLFGLDLAQGPIRRARRAVVVEGYTDVVACHQAGFDNAVGTLGTAFTPDHARKLRGRCDEIVLLFDGDEAGQRAAERAFEALFVGGVDLRVAVLAGRTDAKDPDELLKREGGAAVLAAALDEAEHLIDFWGRRLRARLATLGPAGRGTATREELERLGRLGLSSLGKLERRAFVERIARAAALPASEVAEAVPAGRGRAAGRADSAEGTPGSGAMPEPTDPRARLRRMLLGLSIGVPSAAAGMARAWDSAAAEAAFEPAGLGHTGLERVAGAAWGLLGRGAAPEPSAVLGALAEDDHAGRGAVAGLLRSVAREFGEDAEELAVTLGEVAARLGLAPAANPAAGGDDEGAGRSIEADGGLSAEAGAASTQLRRLEELRRTGGAGASANPWGRGG